MENLKNVWGNYESKTKRSTGYEDVLDKLKSYTKEEYINATPERQEELVNEVFNIYRSKNIFPVTYFNDEGIKEEIRKCIKAEPVCDGKVLTNRGVSGQMLLKYLFPNLQKVVIKGKKGETIYDKFYNDDMLKRAIRFCFLYDNARMTPSGIAGGLRLTGVNSASNFKPMNAKALYERYTPENGVIYDFACGFGGRMLGALSSTKNFKYIGVEPNSETFESLNRLGNYIEDVTGRKNSYELHKMGSEDFKPEQTEFVDFAFTSPPYFNLEQYTEEDSQCYVKYPTLESWFEGYVRPTIKNIYSMLKYDRYYAVNIADFNVNGTRVEFVDKWIEISKEEGFEYVNNISMRVQARRGNGHDKVKNEKREGIFVFVKPSPKAQDKSCDLDVVA